MGNIFCVQDRTGTAAQLVLDAVTTAGIEVGDTGVYTGRNYMGEAISLNFTVGAVNDATNFCITTITPTGAPGDVTKSNWPKSGVITWLTGENALTSPDSTVVLRKHAANAYITEQFFFDYHAARGNPVAESPLDAVQYAIVKGTDYLNQKYRYKGNKLLQYLSNSSLDPLVVFIDPWIIPMGLGNAGIGIPSRGFGPSHTSQFTEWPRAGVIDFNGDSVYGVPQVIMEACAEAAIRELNGLPLQPDYDSDFVGNGGIVTSFSNEVGPIRESRTFDTKLGIGFFPDIPQIRRMLSKAGILLAGGGRTLIR